MDGGYVDDDVIAGGDSFGEDFPKSVAASEVQEGIANVKDKTAVLIF